MAQMLKFKRGDTLIKQGNTNDTTAYLIHSGWIQVNRKHTDRKVSTIRLGPGEIVGELALAGLVDQRTATVKCLTDGEFEKIDRGAMIRLLNSSGNRLAPLMAALFSRLQRTLSEEDQSVSIDEDKTAYARVEGMSPEARKALCNQCRMVKRLPWVFGVYTGPQSVTDLFHKSKQQDVILTDPCKAIREKHIQIEAAKNGGLQLHLMHRGDFCELDDERIGFGTSPLIAPLPSGKHVLSFGNSITPYKFGIHV